MTHRLASRLDAPPTMVRKITDWTLEQVASETLRDVTKRRSKLNDPRRQQQVIEYLGQQGLDDEFVDLATVERLAKHYGGKLPTHKRPKQYKRDFNLDLTGWKHQGLMTPEAIRFLDPITVIWYTSKAHAPARVRGRGGTPNGTWDDIGLLRLFMPTPTPTPKTFKRQMSEFARIIRHELQHLSQTLLRQATGSPGAGMPPDHQPILDDLPYPEEHALTDAEFYTRLQDEIDTFNQMRGQFGPATDEDAIRKAIRIWVDELRPQPVGRRHLQPSTFFTTLKQHDPRKWRKAVGEFVSETLPSSRLATRWLERLELVERVERSHTT